MNHILLCPACNEEAEHDVLKKNRELLVRCGYCGHVYHASMRTTPEIAEIRAIVSHGADSRVCSVELHGEEECRVGDLLVAECGDDVSGVEVTGIEKGERRVRHARARDITTLWTRQIEEVVVKASVHHRSITLPVYRRCQGEEEFEIGEVYQFGTIRFRVIRIKLRDGALMRKEGWRTFARKIKRLYGIRL
jgi:uncharacterized Zn finger protein